MLAIILISFVTIVSGFSIGDAGYNTSRVGPSNAICERQLYNITVSANNTVFKAPLGHSANETVREQSFLDFIVSDVSLLSNFSDAYIASPATHVVTGTYSISGTLCTPKSGEKNTSDIQMLIHGITCDSSYWDFVVGDDESFSYVRASAAAGISTFSFDRLGTGLSEHPSDPYGVLQANTELAIVEQIARMLRNGTISSKGRKYNQVIGVGHSYGSILIEALTAIAPNLFDGILLTGFSANASTILPLTLASTAFTSSSVVFPNRFSGLPEGYLSPANPYSYQFSFWYYPELSSATAARIWATTQPFAAGVMYTFASLFQPALSFTGPVHVVTGAKDFIFCFANCYTVPPSSGHASILDFVKTELYPNVTRFSTYIPANTGHLMNQQESAPETYQNMLAFVRSVFAV